MPLPRWLAQVNKRTFNKLELKRGKRPVITHIGRRSGNVFRTPLDAHAVEGGFVFILNYGADSDWVQNILAAGTATLLAAGSRYELTNPRLITDEVARRHLAPGTKLPPQRMNITEFLIMDTLHSSGAA